ncbi:beta-glucosidase [Edwardsiella tarda]|uniref:beta-glucosidase n=1 Tax=Edwardsiella tarda TaxID=636 RepID=UPI003F659FC5
MKPINRPAQTFWRRRARGALRLGGLLLLCAAPAGLAAGLARYIAWRPLRLILLWLLEPGLRRGVRYATERYFQPAAAVNPPVSRGKEKHEKATT